MQANAVQTELLINRGFEDGSAPWIGAYWGGVSETIPASESEPARTGNYLRKLYGPASEGLFNVVEQGIGAGNGTFPIPAGTVVHCGAWIRVPDADVTPCEVRVRPRFNATGVGTSYNVVISDTNWHFVGDDGTGAGVVTPENDWLAFRVYGPPNRTIYVDDTQCLGDLPSIRGSVVFGDATDPTGTVVTLKTAGGTTIGSKIVDPGTGDFFVPAVAGDYILVAGKGSYVGQASATVAATHVDVNIPMALDPTLDPDLLFAARSTEYDGFSAWVPFYPAGAVLNRINNPTTATINEEEWIWNNRGPGGDTGFELGGIPGLSTGVAADGASIVVAVRPVFPLGLEGERRGEIVSLYYNGLVLATDRETGQVLVARKAWNWQGTGVFLPNGQISILSLVVQRDGSCLLRVNGEDRWNGGSIGDDSFALLQGTDPNWMTRIGVGRNPWDGWSSFNGNIGDVYVYKKAIDETKRNNLEESLIIKYGTAEVFIITASEATAGGRISPSGSVAVPQNTDKTFTITSDYGFVLENVLVDDEPIGAASSYTFFDVEGDHTIEASWVPLPVISGVVADSVSGDGLYSARVTLSFNADGSDPIDSVFTSATGGYTIVPPNPNGTYYLIARKGGHLTSAVKTVEMTGATVPDQDFDLVRSATLDPLVSLDVSQLSEGKLSSWTNGGSLGGTFDAFNLDPNQSPSVVADVAGRKAVVFNQTDSGESRMTLVSTVPTPEEIAGASDWSVSTWIYRTSVTEGGENTYLSWSGRDLGQFRTAQFTYRDNLAAVHWAADYGFDGGTPPAGEWHNFTITYDGMTERLYVNGELRTTRNWILNQKSNTMMMVGGAYWDGNNNGFNRLEDQYWRLREGAISSIQIFDQALTEAEIAELLGGGGDPDSPFALWMAGFANLSAEDRAAGADPDKDTRSNLLEFALKGDPTDPANNGMTAVVIQDTNATPGDELTLVAAVRRGATFANAGNSVTATRDGVVYAVKGSLTLTGADASVSHVAAADTAPASSGLPSLAGTDWEYHTFRLDGSDGLPDKGFLWVEVSEAE